MISLTPIPNRIQKRLFEKMTVLGRQSSFPNKSSNGVLTHDKMATRSTFLRMTSGQTNAVVLMGGLLDYDKSMKGGYDEIYGSRSYKIGGKKGLVYGLDYETDWDLEEITSEIVTGVADNPYDRKGTSGKKKRPTPGVKSIDVSFKGGVKALREATISWTCWEWAELDILMPHFLAHGKTVMVEWGWVYDDTTLLNLPSFLVNDSVGNVFIHADAYNNYRNKVVDANGDFDMMVGVIKNFEYTTRDDGGFDCQTILSSIGINVLDNTEKTPSLVSPSTIYDISLNEDPKDTKAKIEAATGEESDGKIDNLIKLNTIVSFKAFLGQIDKYIQQEVASSKNSKGENVDPWDYGPQLGYANIEVRSVPNKFLVVQTKEALGSSAKIKEAWGRWGWFEDNILSKFLSVTSEDPENPIITEFRSVERILTTKGKDTGRYESTIIRNNKRLETVNVNSYILPGQFFPFEYREIKDDDGKILKTLEGDKDWLIKLFNMTKERENFEPFSTKSDIIEKVVDIDEEWQTSTGGLTAEANTRLYASDPTMKNATKEVRTARYKELFGETESSEVTVPGKYGYLRNMLIHTQVIKDAFEGSINIIEGIQQLFSILNQEFNFWNFDLVVDEIDTHRVKIIDTATTNVNFSRPINEQRSRVSDSGEVFTMDSKGNKGDEGVFYFPVWQSDSLVKRQDVTAKLPSSMQLAAMYGSNVDALKEFGNHESVFNPVGVIAGALTNDVKDKNKSGLDIAIKNFTTRGIGQRDGDSTKPITINGGDNSVYEFLKSRSIIMSLEETYNVKLKEIDNDINTATAASQNEEINKLYDPALPPPMPRFMDIDDWRLLFDATSELYTSSDPKLSQEHHELVVTPTIKYFETTFGQKFSEGKMKPNFVNNINRSVSGFGAANKENLPIIIPLELELEIDGIGGIYPANSFHSEYLPKRYKRETVFQAMDVNHKLDSSGWTTTLRGIMRSTLARAFDKSLSVDEMKKELLDNYRGKVEQTQALMKGKMKALAAERKEIKQSKTSTLNQTEVGGTETTTAGQVMYE